MYNESITVKDIHSGVNPYFDPPEASFRCPVPWPKIPAARAALPHADSFVRASEGAAWVLICSLCGCRLQTSNKPEKLPACLVF
ncbi:hypothetical protein KNP414_05373 [Paenibacillus mucilaginosus KNP414]|uniref:Uncharacterized protein n=1 Tax=Paenibacillus mucilaginosus (strain KNP414) TaxID=1036673 RepID=F8FG77_PAEMK|nr:hypothetical protein KNP414_05373 [Paenibacillus mucilaginosus KNP414]